MDSKRKYIPGILIMTLILLVFSIYAVYNMYSNLDWEPTKPVSSYIKLIENELGITLEGEDDFEKFESVGVDLLVTPKSMDSYTKPCFDFTITKEGVVVKNRLAKEFSLYPISTGDVITHVDDLDLTKLTYFEILEAMYSKENNVVKTFKLQNGTSFEYKYTNYTKRYETIEENDKITIKFYNLDNLSRKSINDLVKGFDKIVFDLSEATITKEEDIKAFVSFFSSEDQILFSNPKESVFGYKTFKLNNVSIVLGNTTDIGILFMSTIISKVNSSVGFDIEKNNLTKEKFITSTTLENASYKVYIYNYELSLKSSNNNGVII